MDDFWTPDAIAPETEKLTEIEAIEPMPPIGTDFTSLDNVDIQSTGPRKYFFGKIGSAFRFSIYVRVWKEKYQFNICDAFNKTKNGICVKKTVKDFGVLNQAVADFVAVFAASWSDELYDLSDFVAYVDAVKQAANIRAQARSTRVVRSLDAALQAEGARRKRAKTEAEV